MSTRDMTKVVLGGISQKEKAQLDDKLLQLHELKDSVTNDEDKQVLTEVIDLSTKAHTYNKNTGFSDDLYTIADKLKGSSNKDIQKKGKALTKQLNTQKQAILDWNDKSKKTQTLQNKITRTHRNMLMNIVAFETTVVQDINSRNDSVVAQEAANAMSTSLAKAESKSSNVQTVKRQNEAKQEATTAKRKHEEFKANPTGKTDKENEQIEEQLKQDADMKHSNTRAVYQVRNRKKNNETAAAAKRKLEKHRATGKSDKESKLVEIELQQDADMKALKTLRGRYQQKNAICGYTKENLVSIAIDHLRRGRFYVPLSATKRSKERCERFSEAFRSRDHKKLLSLYSNK